MNAARALGNQGDPDNVPPLVQSLNSSPHNIVRGMSACSLGRLGGTGPKLLWKFSDHGKMVRSERKLNRL